MSAKNCLLLLIWVFLSLSFFGSAQEKEDPVFSVNILLSSEGKKVKDFTIYLRHNGMNDDTIQIRKGKRVYVTLKKNEMYYFTFHKEGLQDKIMLLNTTLPLLADTEELFNLDFEVQMLPAGADGRDSATQKAYVAYDSAEDDFSLLQNH
jgi:hypothetical protein